MAERKPPSRRTTKRAATPRKRGERVIPITEDMIREAERAARAGHTDREIIDHLGISSASFYNWRNTGDAWREKNRAAIENGDPAPAMDARTTRCVELAEALARGRARVYADVSDTALREALGGGVEEEVREEWAYVKELEDTVLVRRVRTTRKRAPNPRLLEFILARRFRHAWGTDAMPTTAPDDGERDAVLNLLGEERVQAALRDLEAEVGRAQEQASDAKGK